MQGLAKTIITLFCVYWLINLILGIFYLMFFAVSSKYKARVEIINTGMILSFLFYVVIILVIAGVLRKRNGISLKIAGDEEIKEIDVQVKWIPFAYRLISVIAGLFCFYRAGTYLQRIGISRFQPNWGIFEIIFIFVPLIAAGIYFLCGAPHFIRWQVKKTMEIYTEK
jgi:hypothetical protein